MSHPPQHPRVHAYAGPAGWAPSAPGAGSIAVAVLLGVPLAVAWCFLAVPGVITSLFALGFRRTHPEAATKLIAASWIIYGVALLGGCCMMYLLGDTQLEIIKILYFLFSY